MPADTRMGMSKGTQQSPIHGGFSNPPATIPLGVPIADRVSIREIDRRTADRIYESHHSYLPRGRKGYHYGVYFDGQIVGSITFDAWPSQSEIRNHPSSEIYEVARVCIAHDTPNLASCAMAKTQDKFVKDRCDGIELLITYIRDGYKGSMFKALRGKGWEFDGISKGRSRGPHHGQSEVHDIYKTDKERWVCEI